MKSWILEKERLMGIESLDSSEQTADGMRYKSKKNPKKTMICLACGRWDADQAHVKSRGAGGSNSDWNIIPLCRTHHQEQHQFSWRYFINKYPKVGFHLKELGWEWEENGTRFYMRNAREGNPKADY